MKISTTAVQSGRGTDQFKSVVGLSTSERKHLQAGGSVYFLSQYRSGGNWGTYWRRVDYNFRGRHYYNPRVPTQEELDQILMETA